MTRLPLQQTRYQRQQQALIATLFSGWGGSWRSRSLQLLALLSGFYLGSNVTVLLLTYFWGGRPGAVLLMVLVVELLVRLRSRFVRGRPAQGWLLVDNLRLGVVYAVVLEAFKLGT